MCTTSNTDPHKTLASSSCPPSTIVLICRLKPIQAPVERSTSSVWTATWMPSIGMYPKSGPSTQKIQRGRRGIMWSLHNPTETQKAKGCYFGSRHLSQNNMVIRNDQCKPMPSNTDAHIHFSSPQMLLLTQLSLFHIPALKVSDLLARRFCFG